MGNSGEAQAINKSYARKFIILKIQNTRISNKKTKLKAEQKHTRTENAKLDTVQILPSCFKCTKVEHFFGKHFANFVHEIERNIK